MARARFIAPGSTLRVDALRRLSLAIFASAIAGACGALAVPACSVFSGVTFDPDGGAPPPPDAPPDGLPPVDGNHYLSLKDAARVCSLVSSCNNLAVNVIFSLSVPVDVVSFSRCVTWMAGPIPKSRIGFKDQQAMLECIVAAPDCTAAGECLEYENIDATDPRCKGMQGMNFCDSSGMNAINCKDIYAEHCANQYWGAGSKCVIAPDGTANCAVSATCNVSDNCLGQYNTFCTVDNLSISENCTVVGNTCGVDPTTKSHYCLTDGVYASCKSAAVTCDSDDQVQVCDGDTFSLFDCKDLGEKCDDSSGGIVCSRAGDACSMSDPDVNVCKGDIIHLCVGGQPADFDCTTIGKKCAEAQGMPAQCL